VAQRRGLEGRWRAYFDERGGDSIAATRDDQWIYPLGVRGRLLNNYNNPRATGPHEALDIFVTREGALVRSPIAGVVVASGDQWQGGWTRRPRGLHYEGGGLSRRAGNGAIIYDPVGDQWVYFAHLQPGVSVHAGDVVRAGQTIGRVGHTGNAAEPGHGRHLHFAYKRPGTECGVEGVLKSVNPYRLVRAARDRRATTRVAPTGPASASRRPASRAAR
jgi:murein DD-endopeptidase MepM/ murein hydrolase activator NlpD